MTTAAAPRTVQIVDPMTLKGWLDQGQVVLIDVREPFEHASVRIARDKLVPLTGFQTAEVPNEPSKKLVLYCKAGIRSVRAAELMLAAGRPEAYSLTGGIEAWKKAGLPVVQSAGGPRLDAQRQVFVIVSLMILTGLALGLKVNAWWLILPAMAGGGLMLAGLTGFCPMLLLVRAMPWNRAPKPGTTGGSTCCGG
ncbi:MAG: rhodanese-like domain-containing protein [Phycisphaeraceae bacterium]|nr:rhodanese-like domain-containing protein [Phycisphaeraceae bacterium]